MRHVIFPLVAALAALTSPVSSAADQTLRIAAWNLEWLIAPEEFRKLADSCIPRDASPGPRQRSIPCNVAQELERSSLDFRALERYAKQLDADVVALQEVDGPAAGVQNTGFAVRKGVPYRCAEDFVDLSLDDRVRRGAVLIVYPGEKREIRLLSVHLKAGCPRRPLDDPRRDCQTLAQQVPVLERWIDEQAAAGRRFAVLGDFNHDLLADTGSARNEQGQLRNFWAEIDDGEPTGADLVNVAEGQRFMNCAPDQNYRSYIDHVVLGAKLAEWRVPNSLVRVAFDAQDALERKLADHCPVGVDLRIPR
jgi:endonuclease/exonuclease/phosphatase family metal-dependent hydrolase